MGMLPAIAVGLVRKPKESIASRLNTTDASDAAQAVIFEGSKNDAPALPEVLRTRAPQASVEVQTT
jgi:hypothetical protein